MGFSFAYPPPHPPPKKTTICYRFISLLSFLYCSPSNGGLVLVNIMYNLSPQFMGYFDISNYLISWLTRLFNYAV